MLKFVNYDVVFQEIPDEVTLAINLSNCPNRCAGCHSPQLQQNIGKQLNKPTLASLIRRYEGLITCICFMGGDAAPDEVAGLARFIQEQYGGAIKTAWYSGQDSLHNSTHVHCFNFIKLGRYISRLGGLNSPGTNQRLYAINSTGTMHNITHKMQQ